MYAINANSFMIKIVSSALSFSIFALEVPYAFAQTNQELFNQGFRGAQQMYDSGNIDASTKKNMSIACSKTRNGQPVDSTIANVLLEQKRYVAAGSAMWGVDWLKKNCLPR